MSLAYRAVDWNRQKRRYDAALGGLLVLGLGVFAGVSLAVSPNLTAETLILRGTAVTALLLLHVILAIGPLARLDRRFLPLLYNRRHLGVTLFLLALGHAALAVFQFHALGDANPLASVFTAYRSDYRVWADGTPNAAHFPFEPFGAAALVILFLMAATSHDFWLRNLGASVWKALHLGVYAAYGLVLAHVAYGVLQSERSALYPVLLGAGFAGLAGLHLATARREAANDLAEAATGEDGFAPACRVEELAEGRGRVVTAGGRRLALFRHEGRVYATANVCRHQGGPVGEGRIVVRGADRAGVFYGVCTLRQLLRQFNNALPAGVIYDWPDFPARGFMLDISRDRVPTLRTLYDLVDRLASWKINQVQLYMEHTFA
ncbi:MAG TPA: ferric reductase-like transmembrane domain-containing protein, partial [Verrucomicrobiota bacterium]|nr:ferric reductase-like transmembrane domain-containing protein [Verrucomicrobiota bacterium]